MAIHTCPIHTRYQAKRKPRCHCLPCWRFYLEMNPEATITGKEMNAILASIVYRIENLEERTTPMEWL